MPGRPSAMRYSGAPVSASKPVAAFATPSVATSHYAELKEWASATEGVANAATGFDADTGAPLYRIALGRPGTSHALRIAGQLGLPDELVEAARTHVAPERLRVAELLAHSFSSA